MVKKKNSLWTNIKQLIIIAIIALLFIAAIYQINKLMNLEIPLSTIIICIVLIFVIILVIGLLNRKRCPKCGEKLPLFRIPTTFKQLAFGGWTCLNCGKDVSAWGSNKN